MKTTSKRARITIYESSPTHSTNLKRDRRWRNDEKVQTKRRTILDEDIKMLKKREVEFNRLITQSFDLESSDDWSGKFQPSDDDWNNPITAYEWSDILELNEDMFDGN